MKRIFSILFSVLLLLSLTGCYKTGEIIFQTTCKPTEVSLPNKLLGITRGYSLEAYISYAYPNKRPVGIQRKGINNQLFEYFTLDYDQANNLVRENIYQNSSGGTVIAYTEYIYPLGTTSSIADSFEKRYYILDAHDLIYKLQWSRNYYFNTEFQVEHITTNGKPMADYVYDFGGNLQKETVYSTFYDPTAAAGVLYYENTYSNYDDKVNLFRTDRYLQLFFDVYSKNNPRKTKTYYGQMLDGTPIEQEYTGTFTYNSQGYWLTCEPGGYYAKYDCYQ